MEKSILILYYNETYVLCYVIYVGNKKGKNRGEILEKHVQDRTQIF